MGTAAGPSEDPTSDADAMNTQHAEGGERYTNTAPREATYGADQRDEDETPNMSILGQKKDSNDEEKRVQDVLVPWVLSNPTGKAKPKPLPARGQRTKGRVRGKDGAKSSSLPTGKESVEDTPNRSGESEDVSGPNDSTADARTGLSISGQETTLDPTSATAVTETAKEDKVYHRYYHLFVEGELEALVEEAGRAGGYDVLPRASYASETKRGAQENAKGIEGLSLGSGDGTDGGQIGKASVADGDAERSRKWLRVKGVGWEADNWWLEAEVGVGDAPPGRVSELVSA